MSLVVGNQLPPKKNAALTKDHQMKKVINHQNAPLLYLGQGTIAPLNNFVGCVSHCGAKQLIQSLRWIAHFHSVVTVALGG